MNNQIDEIMYVNENHVVVYLVGRQFDVVTNNGSALALTVELLFPHFEMLRLKQEEVTQLIEVAA